MKYFQSYLTCYISKTIKNKGSTKLHYVFLVMRTIAVFFH